MADRLPPPPMAEPPPTTADVWLSADVEHSAEAAKEVVSTLLSTLAILAVTVGVTWGLWPHWGPWSLCCGGAVLALLVSVADQARKPARQGDAEARNGIKLAPGADPKPVRSPPGPTDAGNLHTKGPGAAP